ncbi:MAG: universal stress protein [Actinomycetota bacterium]|nr:universal stress protein [Actinomycetota bacterium]NNN09416.1 universal stress protein [Acidimicrobiaceae bacterium]
MTRSKIVVGIRAIDYQPLLDWATDEASRWDFDLLIVHCIKGRLSTEMPYSNDEEQQQGLATLDDAIEYSRNRGLAAVSLLREGFAGEILVQCALEAKQLVVGGVCRTRLRNMLQPSITTYCVHHAPCPLTIVPLPH